MISSFSTSLSSSRNDVEAKVLAIPEESTPADAEALAPGTLADARATTGGKFNGKEIKELSGAMSGEGFGISMTKLKKISI